MKQLLVLVFLLIFAEPSIFGQTKKDGKLRIRLDKDFIEKIQDSCYLSIIGGDSIIEKIDLVKFKNEIRYVDDLNFFDKWLQKGTYIGIIDNLTKKPILINDIIVKTKKMTFLFLDLREVSIDNQVSESLII